ncbi:MAG: phosphomannomutase/phosphoglucomutase [Arenimonas sp.]|uniref:phosphomannomutase/phosphoglucomutase n=1 Tax=Arenimonas sp. TaxID=1872635 RepID=UPI0025B943BD|nr:phosphomannomutase/phosphoglucomutase [Arenimonas sp.]MBW8367944.1 phosphomannomutase/phosphoglucomutase [Arenimonas sp.]
MKFSAANAAQRLRSASPYLVAGIVALAGAFWFGWQGLQSGATEDLGRQVEAARVEVAGKVGDQARLAVEQLEAARSRIALTTALKRNDDPAARDVIAQALPGAEAIEWHEPGLNAAYEKAADFGYGKLGVLEMALQNNGAQAAVVMDAGGPRLGVAAPVLEDGRVLTLVYVRLPVEGLTAPVQAATLSGGYLALRQGRQTISEAGDTTLAGLAEADAVKIPGTGLRVVGAAPAIDAGLGTWTNYLFAALCLVVGLGLVAMPHLKGLRLERRPAEGSVAVDEPTMAELQARGEAEPPPAPLAVAAAATAGAATGARPVPVRASLERSIFRAYDIRGVVGKTLDAETARLIGQAIGTLMHNKDARTVVVGRDGRLSSPQMADALIQGLRQAGCEVINIGEAPTPVVYFAAYQLRAGSCVSVTGSHNPPDYNGFKIVIEGETLSGDAIVDIYERIAENRLHLADTPGLVSHRDVTDDYIQRIAGDIQIERKLKVVVDCGSGIAGLIAPRLMEAIGADVEPLFCEVDGTFPHHHPDPSDPANLRDLVDVVQRVGADIGLAFDGDGDRLGVVTKSGEMIYPDRLLMLFAADVLERNPGACIIYDVKCTGHLAMHILRNGGSPLMWKTGHSLIKAKMRETEAELAGEMSGHFFFRERWYGFDDGLYAAARLLEILASRPETPQEVFDTLPKGVSTPELKIEMEEGEQYAFVEKFLATAKFEGARIATIDGLRADWPDGWGLVRASNTTPVVVMRFDAKDTEVLERIKNAFREQMLAVRPDLNLPF